LIQANGTLIFQVKDLSSLRISLLRSGKWFTVVNVGPGKSDSRSPVLLTGKGNYVLPSRCEHLVQLIEAAPFLYFISILLQANGTLTFQVKDLSSLHISLLRSGK
jgi:hypothetical protein